MIVNEFADVVESGKDEDWPGFQDLAIAVKNRNRGWNTVLMLDTGRLSRRRHISVIFEEIEAKKHGVKVAYKSQPETDPITDMLLQSIVQAMDEWQSLTTKRKGLAGMEENVRKGFRAGGRAPFGYRLNPIAIGTVRDGVPVMKSKLVPEERAPVIARYLTPRAKGHSRSLLPRQLNIELAPTTSSASNGTP